MSRLIGRDQPMQRIAHLKTLIEAKSGACPGSYGPDAVCSRLGYDVAAMHCSGYDPAIIAEHEMFNQHLEAFVGHPEFGSYLANLTPREVHVASGVRLLPLDAIRVEIQEFVPSEPTRRPASPPDAGGQRGRSPEATPSWSVLAGPG